MLPKTYADMDVILTAYPLPHYWVQPAIMSAVRRTVHCCSRVVANEALWCVLQDGGGFYFDYDSPATNTITDCTFRENMAGGNGGAGWVNAPVELIIEGSLFDSNAAKGGEGSNGVSIRAVVQGRLCSDTLSMTSSSTVRLLVELLVIDKALCKRQLFAIPCCDASVDDEPRCSWS
jgi:hypothetical protein